LWAYRARYYRCSVCRYLVRRDLHEFDRAMNPTENKAVVVHFIAERYDRSR
jgi:hypothetical protein